MAAHVYWLIKRLVLVLGCSTWLRYQAASLPIILWAVLLTADDLVGRGRIRKLIFRRRLQKRRRRRWRGRFT